MASVEAAARPAVRRGVVAVAAGPRGSTVTRAYAESPLKWLTPGNGGRAAWVFAASYGGGLVGGDHLSLEVDVAAGAAALLSTQASTKVYRSATGASTRLAARVGERALLVSLPDPVVCFAGSDYRQTQAFALDSSGGLVAVDWMASGRRGSGERWAFDGYASTTRVRIDGRLALHDAVRLDRADGDLAARAGRFDVLAVAVIAGERWRATRPAWCRRCQRCRSSAGPPSSCRPRRCPASRWRRPVASFASPGRMSRTSAASCAASSTSCPGTSATIPGPASGNSLCRWQDTR